MDSDSNLDQNIKISFNRETNEVLIALYLVAGLRVAYLTRDVPDWFH